ncbi:hypothetical protein [Massilia sp. 9I]|uniref:hypothetical protein n=1 Tax=Massilia sp. 9I TaxID=2653152 RepID=UPI0012EF83E1|nr:hypothetical protein [Massilia sp. 9I]VXB81318.1 hypothetical protein MASSI9I_50386 [Massilia sp. 9I]
MNPYSLMLRKASMEILQFQQTSAEADHFKKGWFEQIASRLEHASCLSEPESAEREILSMARSDADSGPLNENAMPSFYVALDAVQRTRKRRSV